MKTRNQLWLLLLLAALFSIVLSACSADDLNIDVGAADSNRLGVMDGDGDNDGIDYSLDDDGDGLADLEDVAVDERVEFIGRVDSISGDEWLIDDCRLVLVEETAIGGPDGDNNAADNDVGDDDANDDNDADVNDNAGDDVNDDDNADTSDRDDDLGIEEGDVVRVKAVLTTGGELVAEQIVLATEKQAERYIAEHGDDEEDDDNVCLLVGEDRDRGFGWGNEGDGNNSNNGNPGRGNDGNGNPGRGPGEDGDKDKNRGRGNG